MVAVAAAVVVVVVAVVLVKPDCMRGALRWCQSAGSGLHRARMHRSWAESTLTDPQKGVIAVRERSACFSVTFDVSLFRSTRWSTPSLSLPLGGPEQVTREARAAHREEVKEGLANFLGRPSLGVDSG